MRVFTQHDVANSICSHEEVGQPWEDRWGIDDHFKGLCTMDQVGSAKPIAPPPEPPPASVPFTSLADATEQAFEQVGIDAYFTWAKENPRAFFDLAAKHGFSAMAKTKEKALPNLDDITEEDITSLPSDQLKLILLKSVGITKKSELDALKD